MKNVTQYQKILFCSYCKESEQVITVAPIVMLFLLQYCVTNISFTVSKYIKFNAKYLQTCFTSINFTLYTSTLILIQNHCKFVSQALILQFPSTLILMQKRHQSCYTNINFTASEYINFNPKHIASWFISITFTSQNCIKFKAKI